MELTTIAQIAFITVLAATFYVAVIIDLIKVSKESN